MFKFLGNLFTGSGSRTGTGIALFIAGPLVKHFTGLDLNVVDGVPVNQLDAALAASYDNTALGFIGGGGLGKLAGVITGRIKAPHVQRPPAGRARVGTLVFLAFLLGALASVPFGLLSGCASRVTVRPPHVPTGMETIVDSHLPENAQPDSIYATAILSSSEAGVATLVPVIAVVTGPDVVYFAVPTIVRTVPDSVTMHGEVKVLWYEGIPVLDVASP